MATLTLAPDQMALGAEYVLPNFDERMPLDGTDMRMMPDEYFDAHNKFESDTYAKAVSLHAKSSVPFLSMFSEGHPQTDFRRNPSGIDVLDRIVTRDGYRIGTVARGGVLVGELVIKQIALIENIRTQSRRNVLHSLAANLLVTVANGEGDKKRLVPLHLVDEHVVPEAYGCEVALARVSHKKACEVEDVWSADESVALGGKRYMTAADMALRGARWNIEGASLVSGFVGAALLAAGVSNGRMAEFQNGQFGLSRLNNLRDQIRPR